jgi:putative selenium metabolism protein SsnA
MLITNATVATWECPNRLLTNHSIYISGDRIREIGPSSKIDPLHPKTRRLDADGQLVMPGAICAHTHFYSAFARGLAVPDPAPKDFPDILNRLWWPLDRALHEDDVRYCALMCLVDAIRNGTTTLFDHHVSPSAIDGSLDVIAEAVDKSGLRAVLCYEVSDRNGPETTDAGIKENVRFSRRLASNPQPRLAAMFGLHASLTLSGATLQACRSAAPEGAGFHIHVAEHEADQYDSLGRTQMRVVDRLNNHGILGPKTIAAHCVHVDAAEIQVLKETGTWVTHQPRSNMNNAVGSAPVESLHRAGVRVCLGNDGFSNAMWDEWKAAYFLHKATSRDPRRMDGGQLMQMAIRNAAALAGSYFTDAPIGVLVPGAFADLVLVDYQSPTPVTADNLPWHIIFGFQPGMVTTTIVAGKVLMRDRKLLTLNEAEIAAHARELASKAWNRFFEAAKS